MSFRFAVMVTATRTPSPMPVINHPVLIPEPPDATTRRARRSLPGCVTHDSTFPFQQFVDQVFYRCDRGVHRRGDRLVQSYGAIVAAEQGVSEIEASYAEICA